MEINPEIQERIFAAADKLYQDGGQQSLPSVDAVRRAACAGMSDTSIAMKEWRRRRSAQAAPAVVSIPEPVVKAHNAALAALWKQAQDLANESLLAVQSTWETERNNIDALREEIVAAYEVQAAELEKVSTELATAQEYGQAMDQKAAAADARAERAELRAEDLVSRVADMRDELNNARKAEGVAKEESAELRGRLAGAMEQIKELMEAVKKK